MDTTTRPFSYKTIRIEHAGSLTWLILNRPDKANALSTELLDEFSDALKRLETEGGAVIAIRGEGRGFSSGYDMGQYGKVDYDPGTVANDKRDSKKLLLAVTVPFGASTLKASYLTAKGAQGSSATDFDAKQIAFGYQYDLSKRTAIYATVSSLNNDGNATSGARFTVGQGVAMVRGGDTSRGYNLGVRHSF